jgi:hypothetical protein
VADNQAQEPDPRKQLNDATRHLERHRIEMVRLDELRAYEMARIDAWYDDMASGELAEIARLEAEIEQWAIAHRTDRTKSWKTPWAQVTTRPKAGKAVIDDERLLVAWCEQNGYLAAPPPPKADIKAIRAQYEVTPSGNIVSAWTTDEDGERAVASMIPGVHVEGADEIGVTVKPFVARGGPVDDDEGED